MPTRKPPAGAPTPTPAQTQLMPAITWMVYGMGLGMLTIFVRMMWFVQRGDVNASFATAAWVVAVGIALPWLLNVRQGWKRIAAVVSCSLYTSVLMAGMLLFLTGTVVSNFFADSPKVQQFVSDDFAQFEQNGTVSSTRLDAELQKQNKLRTELREMQDVHKTVDSSSASAPTKWAANTGLFALEADLKTQILPDQELERMRAVSNHMYLVGTNGTATRWQLANYERELHQKFPLWEWLLRKVGAIS